ncbi:PucR family transcriptional regulator [Cohnella sp. CFH 77786]|uniref:PucR family transcriptional regulator n=1 Tax=Cohnella sp. CFH 77786 TaxID=2662265 RepID=UPI001C609C82|nr:helix-turn-helix domain-containing protein [Cohnella sp. CFH 77786]MBW5448998.1 PucR family transcriptional regulator [Cohnella sp. CFH 77786]
MQNTTGEQLERLLGAKAAARTIPVAEWEQDGGGRYPEAGDMLELPEAKRFVARVSGSDLQVYDITAELTALERELLRLLLQQKNGRPPAGTTDLERQARKLGEWIGQCAAGGEWRAEVPDRMELRSRLFDGMIPFLLLCEQAEDKEPSYADLEKALRSFLTEDTLLVPLREHEWLILAPDRMLAETETGDDEMVDSDEGKGILSSLASGLHQMVTGEWGGECHVAAGEPIDPTESVVHAVAILRETIQLGRKFHVGMQVHLPWLIHLERLLSGIPEAARSRFVEEMMGRPDLFNDPETVSTLDAFFAMDCNVSETAKKLFIHRNTLLYRLDKIKQDSGLDVRSFNDAVLVRILLLLYKVTKRK